MKKTITLLLAAALCALGAVADEEVTMVLKEITTLSVPFAIKSYLPSDKSIVRIEKLSDTTLRLVALQAGRCDLEVSGGLDMVQKFQITVGGDLPKVLDNLQRELETVPEVHAQIFNGRIRLDGEIKSIRKWNYFMKVIAAYQEVRSFVTFWPNEDTLYRIKESLRQSGFTVLFDAYKGPAETWKANHVAISLSKINRQMLVQARVYTPEQQQQIMSCFQRESRWLKMEGVGADNGPINEDSQLSGIFKIVVSKPQIRFSVAYMAVGMSDLQKIGNLGAVENENGGVDLTGAISAFARACGGYPHDHNRQGAAGSIAGSLGFNTRFFKKNGLGKVSDVGYTTIESWDPAGANFKSGGSRYCKVSGHDAAGLESIEYGFTINAKGGLVDDGTMSVDFDFEMSTIIPTGDDYDRREDTSKQKLTLPLGRTTIVSGFNDLVDENMPASGFPFVRSTPILNWFVADSSDEVTDRKLIILVCPEIVDNTDPCTLDVESKIDRPLAYYREKTTEEAIEDQKRKRHDGWWYWLNWFEF